MTDNFEADRPHRRRNPLTDEWVLVSPQRGNRPWQGAEETPHRPDAPAHDPDCYLCARNTRVTGDTNPDYRGPYVFANDFPALLKADGHEQNSAHQGLLQREPVSGEARVICFSERHDLPLPRLSVAGIEAVVDCWVQQYEELARSYDWVAIFENKGAAMGCSNPHPHGQIWASSAVPTEVAKEERNQRAYFDAEGSSLLRDYVQTELADGAREVVRTAHWLVVVPYWAIWPFETLLLPIAPVARLSELNAEQKADLAVALNKLTVKYDNLFQTEFPYSMGWHGAPPRLDDTRHWQLHAHFYPPLLRSASVKKFMVGYEMMAEAQRDITPEQAAERLRAQSETHYLDR